MNYLLAIGILLTVYLSIAIAYASLRGEKPDGFSDK
jgi:hypothetical protein